MDLFKLKREKAELEASISSTKERIELARSRLDFKAIDYSKPVVQSSPHKDPMSDIVGTIAEMEQYLDYSIKLLKQNEEDIDKFYKIAKQFKDRDKQIYIEKNFYKWSNAKISIKHDGLGKSQIYRILKKFNNRGKKGNDTVVK